MTSSPAANPGVLLAFDTSTASGSVAVLRDGVALSERSCADAGAHATWLMPAVHGALTAAGLRAADVGAVAVATGPGSFTGLRIGVSTAKALAWALGVKVKGVSSLEALAMNLSSPGRAVCAMFDARKGMVYAAVYRMEDARMQVLLQPSELTPGAAVTEALRLARGGGVTFIGSGARVAAGEISKAGALAEAADASLWHVRAASVAAIALSSAGGWLDPAELTPLYLRASEAELKRPVPPAGHP